MLSSHNIIVYNKYKGTPIAGYLYQWSREEICCCSCNGCKNIWERYLYYSK